VLAGRLARADLGCGFACCASCSPIAAEREPRSPQITRSGPLPVRSIAPASTWTSGYSRVRELCCAAAAEIWRRAPGGRVAAWPLHQRRARGASEGSVRNFTRPRANGASIGRAKYMALLRRAADTAAAPQAHKFGRKPGVFSTSALSGLSVRAEPGA